MLFALAYLLLCRLARLLAPPGQEAHNEDPKPFVWTASVAASSCIVGMA